MKGQKPLFTKSDALNKRACAVIPLGSQTFSKSAIQYPVGHAPLFLSHGKGARSWDADGNEYVDLVMGLLPNILGYCDPDVDEAIRRQMEKGITFSMATEAEVQLAEKLVEIIPCAEMVRFGKNGTDATSGAIRIARAATGRDLVAVCGYHGWQDWYVGSTTRNKGVPDAVSGMTFRFPYNDLDALDELLSSEHNKFAAVIMEPMNAVDPAPGYLEGAKNLAHKHGAIFIFDEIITGFRYDIGGAQELFGVTPDLATFGKSLGNGMPISVVVGRRDIMMEMEEVFFSSTFGGETLSLAASLAVIGKLQREPVVETLWKRGNELASGALQRIKKHGLESIFGFVGKEPWKIITMNAHPNARVEVVKTLFLREILRHGLLVSASHNVSYALTDDDVAHALAAYDKALPAVAAELERPGVEERLDCPVIEPVFKVR